MPKFYTQDMVGTVESVVDEMLLMSPFQIPMISRIGFGAPITNTLHEWNEDVLANDKTTITAQVAQAATSAIVADVTLFRVNQVAQINEELVLITGVNTGTKTLTITRGFGGTSDVLQANGSTIQAMFNSAKEGSDARDASVKKRTTVQNYTQIFEDTVSITGSAEEVASHGISNLYMYELAKTEERLMYDLEKALVSGIKYTDGAGVRMLGGMRQFIKTNVIDAGGSAAISMAFINKAMQMIYDAGGQKDATNHIMLVSSAQKEAVSDLMKDYRRIERGDTTTGYTSNKIVTNYGDLEIVLDSNLNPDEVMFPDLNRIAVRPLGKRTFGHTYLGKKGDSTSGQVLGEYTLEFKQEQAHARIHNLKVGS